MNKLDNKLKHRGLTHKEVSKKLPRKREENRPPPKKRNQKKRKNKDLIATTIKDQEAEIKRGNF